MENLVQKYMNLSKEDPEKNESWTPIHKDGAMRIYNKTECKDSVTVAVLVALTVVDGVTATEMVEVFHSKDMMMKWDHSIEKQTVIEKKNDNCDVYHQIQKRLWPASQRDIVRLDRL